MLVRVPDNVKEATTDNPWPDVTAIPLEFIYRWASRPRGFSRCTCLRAARAADHAVTDLGEQFGG